MNLKSGYPFWSIRNGLMRPYPCLEQDTQCEVAIIGGGVTAALIAHELLRHGHEVVVIEQREIGWGSTSASTALLQYEIDTPMVDLAAQYGMPAAALAYGACAKAILDLQSFAWGGTFAETADGLPFFGTHPEHGPRVAFAMAYGGNGITYSAIGAGLLRAQLEGRAHPLSDLFGFSRLG
ncbi:FAD-dependent oxidoreductase [Xanthomonas campestris]|uniref:FAD-dependent oxidoreductase n=1 Tax=Xanthomonas campestris TaxID=339 RepID=UPI002B2313B9|nr:FAD-dependent oxidoreductase [Xanthomonas campestris]MEA9731049.1 FAD-dependent oxidoreductase [Xanthomonas campestris]